jgi:hypothetical protein
LGIVGVGVKLGQVREIAKMSERGEVDLNEADASYTDVQ